MTVLIADRSWNERLCDVMRSIPIPGAIELAYHRDPDFFAGLGIEGSRGQAIVAAKGGELAATVSRSVRAVWVDGEPAEIGYVSAVRVRPEFRAGMYTARAYLEIGRQDRDDPVPGYLASFIRDNARALDTFARAQRQGLPRYFPLGEYVTCAIAVRMGGRRAPRVRGGPRRASRRRARAITIEPCDDGRVEEAFACYNRLARTCQLAPRYAPADLDTPLLLGLRAGDLLIARDRAGRATGTLALWDQGAFKRHVVVAYHGALGVLRPAVNAAAAVARMPGLPAPGEALPMCYAALARAEDAATLAALLASGAAECARRGHRWLVVGFHERDPLLAAVLGLPRVAYRSLLYWMEWGSAPEDRCRLDRERLPWTDVAAL
jgi:hypothetical protein